MDLNKPKVEEAKPTRKEILSFNPDRLATSETKEGAKAKEAAAVEKIDPNKLIEPKTRTETEYRDENGTLYRVGKELLPNVEYHLDGYDYRTDSKGRIVHAGGQLKLSGETRQPMKAKIHDVGRGNEKSNDQVGHLKGDRFGGSSDIENTVAMDAKVNQRSYKRIENICAKAIKEGHVVELHTDPKYKGDSHRPSEFRVTYVIDGEKTVVTIKNGESDKK